jgi:hypothetical protein
VESLSNISGLDGIMSAVFIIFFENDEKPSWIFLDHVHDKKPILSPFLYFKTLKLYVYIVHFYVSIAMITHRCIV